MTPKEKFLYALLAGASATISTYIMMSLREQVELLEIG
jgi:hypothetical protein